VTWVIALLLRQLALIAMAFVFACAIYSVRRWIPDCWVKRLLLYEITKRKTARR